MKVSRFVIASIKHTACAVAPLLKSKERLTSKIEELKSEIEKIDSQIALFDAPIKEATGGFGVEELIEREYTEIVDPATGKKTKQGKWVLKYPDTIIPPSETAEVASNNNEATAENTITEDANEDSEKSIQDNNTFDNWLNK